MVQALPIEVSGGRGRQIDSFVFLAPGVGGNTFSKKFNGGVDFESEVVFNGVAMAQSETRRVCKPIWNPPFELVNELRRPAVVVLRAVRVSARRRYLSDRFRNQSAPRRCFRDHSQQLLRFSRRIQRHCARGQREQLRLLHRWAGHHSQTLQREEQDLLPPEHGMVSPKPTAGRLVLFANAG